MITNADGTRATWRQLGARMVTALAEHGLAAPGFAHESPIHGSPGGYEVLVVAPGLTWLAAADGRYELGATDWQTWDINHAGTAHDAGASHLREMVEMVGPLDHSATGYPF